MAERRRPMSEINVVPYIDVMLVLLVIFMATAPLLTQGVIVDLPDAPSDVVPEDQKDPLVISVRADGAIFLNLGMTSSDSEGDRVTLNSLEETAAKVIDARPDVPVYVRADHGLEYGMVVQVMTSLQKAGAKSVGLITEPPQALPG
jgi:biopolymer transport protein TolR